jgi:ATP-dependent Lon protease
MSTEANPINNTGNSNGNPGNTDRSEIAVPVLPLPGGVVLPGMVVTVVADSPEATEATEAAMARSARKLLLVPRTDGQLSAVGALSQIETAGELPDGRRAFVIRALQRARIGVGIVSPGTDQALWVMAHPAGNIDGASAARVEELAQEYRAVAELVAEHRGWGRIGAALAGIDQPSQLADTIAEWPELTHEQRLRLLETIPTAERLELAIGWLRTELAEQEVKEKIRKDVNEGIEKQQREFMLRQQLSAIRKELGDGEDSSDAVSNYRERLDALNVTSDIRNAIEREIDRLERVGDQGVEQSWIRTWLDTMIELPWGNTSTDSHDVVVARAVLDADTTGLNEAKDRIVEWLAVRALKEKRTQSTLNSKHTDDLDADGAATSVVRGARRGDGAIIVLAGPPGVGKTSLGESVARALGRSFVRVALGGVRDEAEIRGHRRTYVGAQPGRLVRALREAKTMNPVILLDEIDKLATGWSGDPAAALLEVLDPAQNHTFRDHYLEVDLDLSDVVFLATANSLETIPGPLLDRMELITVDGYTDLEKVEIAKKHLLPRQLEQSGLTDDDVQLGDGALTAIIEGYTREAGVRGLERQLAKVMRKVAVQLSQPEISAPLTINNSNDVTALLGRPKRTAEEVANRVAAPGVATGLAVTGVGGDVLFVETAVLDAGAPAESGSADVQLTITGQLGDVMKESAQIATSYLRSHAAMLGLPESLPRRIHVHFPAGAVPKDGPSAGITMTTALVSLLTGRLVRADVAMTGEVTLQGRVLPIGGVKQKLLAAHRAGIKTVIIPAQNEPDLEDVPESVLRDLDVHPVSDIAEVLAIALEVHAVPEPLPTAA